MAGQFRIGYDSTGQSEQDRRMALDEAMLCGMTYDRQNR